MSKSQPGTITEAQALRLLRPDAEWLRATLPPVAAGRGRRYSKRDVLALAARRAGRSPLTALLTPKPKA